MTTIRALGKSDVDLCAEMYVKAYSRPPWNYKWNFDKALKYLTEYLDRGRFVGFVVVENHILVAAMLGHSKTWWTGDVLYIDELFVSPDSQGHGYGRLLLDHSEKYASENGFGVISLMTNKYMPAYKFYTKVKYLQADQFVFFFKSPERPT